MSNRVVKSNFGEHLASEYPLIQIIEFLNTVQLGASTIVECNHCM